MPAVTPSREEISAIIAEWFPGKRSFRDRCADDILARLVAKPADEPDPDEMNERRAAEDANMREALEPFAKVADDYQAAYEMRLRHYGDEGHKAGPPYSDHYQISVSLGDCRKAKAALSTTGEPKR